MNTERVGVVGSGSWGTAVANTFADAGLEVELWGRDNALLLQMAATHENVKYLKGYPLSPALKPCHNLREMVERSDVVVCSIPTQQIRSVFQPLGTLLANKIVVNTSKGIEGGTHSRVSQIFESLAPRVKYVILSGPSFAQEVVARLPTAVTVASTDLDCAAAIQQRLSTPYFRAYTSRDVVGVELAGALKNVVAIAAGVVSGLKLGYNAQAAIINRGMVEMARLGKAAGADPLTFLGLAGMGDLILTCTGPLSRNRRLGLLLGEGKSVTEAKEVLGGVAEGYYTAKSGLALGVLPKVEMPILREVFRVLYEGESPKAALTRLMSRDLKEEW